VKKTMIARKLILSTESLRTLSASQLKGAAGGVPNDNGSLKCSLISGCNTYDQSSCNPHTDSCGG
jgi:hypothetical protein